MQRSVLSASTLPSYQYHPRTPCLHTACAQCWWLYLHKQDCTKHSLRNLKACMQRTVAATPERVDACRALPQPAVGGQQLEDAGHVVQQLQVRARLRTPARDYPTLALPLSAPSTASPCRQTCVLAGMEYRMMFPSLRPRGLVHSPAPAGPPGKPGSMCPDCNNASSLASITLCRAFSCLPLVQLMARLHPPNPTGFRADPTLKSSTRSAPCVYSRHSSLFLAQGTTFAQTFSERAKYFHAQNLVSCTTPVKQVVTAE